MLMGQVELRRGRVDEWKPLPCIAYAALSTTMDTPW
jgi:hypothetical protein